MICPAAEDGGNFHDGNSLSLERLDIALALAKKLVDDLRSGTSFMGKLSALVARLPIPRAGVEGLGGGMSSESSSTSAHSGELGCDVGLEAFRSFVPSSNRESFLWTVPSLDDPETSRISESSRIRCRENALRGRWKMFRFVTVKGEARDLTCSALARLEMDDFFERSESSISLAH
jgi:hypothetical protein